MIILDTNVLSELFKPTPAPEVLGWLAMQPVPSLYTTAVTQAEMLFGLEIMAKGKRRSVLESLTQRMFEVTFVDRILSFDADAARQFALIASYRRALGRPITLGDAQIAAIARSRGAKLATRNTADFEHCGIDVLSPWAPP
jgi:predicted nucleic acid-binding protein